ncbi:MAG: hypothetical protein HY018_03975 [Hydrogenophilales bacterium]|nr:hypothetical protein [Hydrogenophilales bacterium]
MTTTTWFNLSRRHKVWRPRPLRWVLQDMAGVARQPEQAHRTHLRATLEWLCRAQDASRSIPGSVAAGWTFASGWLPGNMDVAGRLIETCLPAADYLAWPELRSRARGMLDTLLAQPDTPSVGRIQGLIAGHLQLDHPESLARAVRSGQALLEAPAHAADQHVHAAHMLARLGSLSGSEAFQDAARRHLDAALGLQTPSGWFPGARVPTSTSTLAGIIRGLIESAHLLDEPRALQAGRRAAQAMYDLLHGDGWLAGAYDDGWTPAAAHACMPGLAQLAGVWLRLAQRGEDAHWHDAAWRALAWIKRNQRTMGDDLALRDALPSAVPIWRGPAAFRFDAMSAKYFSDALMMDMVGIAIPPIAQKVESA